MLAAVFCFRKPVKKARHHVVKTKFPIFDARSWEDFNKIL